jgi:hypothetical protein
VGERLSEEELTQKSQTRNGVVRRWSGGVMEWWGGDQSGNILMTRMGLAALVAPASQAPLSNGMARTVMGVVFVRIKTDCFLGEFRQDISAVSALRGLMQGTRAVQ